MTSKQYGLGAVNNGSLIYGSGGIRSGSNSYGRGGLDSGSRIGGIGLSSIPFKMAKSNLKNITGELGTFARATTATVQDHESVIREVLSGEVRYQGQRRVENIVGANSEDMTAHTPAFATDASATAANEITISAIDGFWYTEGTASLPAGSKVVVRVTISGGTMPELGLRFLVTGGGGTFFTINPSTLTEPTTYSATLTTSADGTASLGFESRVLFGGDGVSTGTIIVDSVQIQDKTGASDPTVPDSYVSTGVLSAPYHGVNVDGVKYFLSTNGNSVTDNVVTEASGTPITDAIGYFGEPTSINKCTNYNANPESGLATLTRTGDAAATMTRVTDAAELAAVGLDATCTSSYVVKLDNSAGAGLAWVQPDGTVGNTNKHSLSCWARKTAGTCFIQLSAGSPTGQVEITSATYEKVISENVTPGSTGKKFTVEASAGGVVYFILNQLEEKAFATSEIITEGSAVTRNKDDLSYPTTNIPVNDCVFSFDWTPTADAQGVAVFFSTGDTANDRVAFFVNTTTFTFSKNLSAVTNNATLITAYTAGVAVNLKGRLSSADGVDIWVDDVKGTGDATATDAIHGATLRIGEHWDSTLHQTGGIDNFTVYQGNFTDAEVVAL